MARCFNAHSPRWDCDARPRAGSARGCLNHLRAVEFRRVTFRFHPVGRLAQAAACKAAKAGAIPARDSILSSSSKSIPRRTFSIYACRRIVANLGGMSVRGKVALELGIVALLTTV